MSVLRSAANLARVRECPGQHPRPPRCRRLAARALAVLGCALPLALAGEPRPPVFPALELGWENFDPGERLLAELHCTACHEAGSAVTGRLRPPPAPQLLTAGARLRPDFLRAWLASPLTTMPGTTMPDVLGVLSPAARAEAVEDLTHFLLALAPPPAATPPPGGGGELAFQQGRVLYHQSGCVACHAPFEPAARLFPHSVGAPTDPEGLRYALARLQDTSPALPDLAAKYRPGALAAFLANPLESRPAGRMPSLNLTAAETHALATYLNRVTAATAEPPAPPRAHPDGPAGGEPFPVDPERARRGQRLFAEVGCAACHAVEADGAPLPSRLRAPEWSALRADSPTGCLAPEPGPRAARYVLSAAQRTALRDTLQRRENLLQPPGPAQRVTHTLVALNCTACHARDGLGGPSPSRADYFTTLGEADLGDEGRLPPHLSSVGYKLRPDWLGQVLTNRAVVRPYLAVRMPQYGAAQVAHLALDFPASDGGEGDPAVPAGEFEAGRQLAGVEGGYGCIQCHRWGPYPALGVSVMDLTRMTARLRWPWFHAYLLDPPSLRPGTRMPAFWPDGRATVPNLLEGDAERQIAALWAYLARGTNAPLPPGLLTAPRTPAASPEDYE